MSKQSEAKKKQEYDDKPKPNLCGNCPSLKFDMQLPKWMQERNDGVANGTTAFPRTPWGDEHKVQKNLRCGKGGFAIKKAGTCAEWGS